MARAGRHALESLPLHGLPWEGCQRQPATPASWPLRHPNQNLHLSLRQHIPPTLQLIIGDEILAAKVEDANSGFLCRELRAIGWDVTKVVVVGDSVPDIAREAAALSEAADVVLTAGGVGPTPDDVTMQALAGAGGEGLHCCCHASRSRASA